jgi:hypothetical protein
MHVISADLFAGTSFNLIERLFVPPLVPLVPLVTFIFSAPYQPFAKTKNALSKEEKNHQESAYILKPITKTP